MSRIDSGTAYRSYDPLVQSDDQLLQRREGAEFITRGREEDNGDAQVLYRPPSSLWHALLVWLALGAAVLAGASIGPVFRYMMHKGVSACLAAAWRSQAMALSLSPLAVLEALRENSRGRRVAWLSTPPDLTFPVCVHVFISGLAWSGNLLFWVLGLQFVSTFAAALVATCHPILLVLMLRFSGHRISVQEWIGVFVAFAGTCVCNLVELWARPETEGTHTHSSTMQQLLGLLLCLLSAAAEVVVIFNRIKIRRHVPLMQFTTVTSVVVTFVSIILALAVEDARFFIEKKDDFWWFCLGDRCVFGWLSREWASKVVFFGIWVGVVVTTAFNYTMQYVPPLVISSLALLEPSLTAILSWIIGVESLPHFLSWIGGVVVAVGVATISIGEKRRRQLEKRLSAITSDSAVDVESEINEKDEDNVELIANRINESASSD